MSKTIDEVTQEELESLYLENDWDVKKIAGILNCTVQKVYTKFSSFYNTEEEIQNLVYKFRITGGALFNKLSHVVYQRSLKYHIKYYHILLDELIIYLKKNYSFIEIAKKYKISEYNIKLIFCNYFSTIEDFKYLIEIFKFENYKEFQNIFPLLSKKAIKLGIKACQLFPNSKRWLGEFRKDFEKAKNYILIELGCKTATELLKKDLSFYDNIWCEFNNKQKELIFPGVTNGSSWETAMNSSIQKEFPDCKIISQKTFEDCKNINQLRFDLALYSPSGKLIALIEIQGKTHFTKVYKNEKRTKFENIRKRDIIKYEYCKKNNIPLFYFTYEPSLVEKYGYPYFVYTDFEELVKAIRELLQKVS